MELSPNAGKTTLSTDFPIQLHLMLNHITHKEPELLSVVSWKEHGLCFHVKNPMKFTQFILHRFFPRMAIYESFQWALIGHGFKRLTYGPDNGAYYHDLFVRGNKELCKGILRIEEIETMGYLFVGKEIIKERDTEPDTDSTAAPNTEVRERLKLNELSLKNPFKHCKFPLRLYKLLSHIAENETELSSIISWQPHGRCFCVRKKTEFIKIILPRYFIANKWSSFQNQLSIYSFTRIKGGLDDECYYHSNFLRGREDLCALIERNALSWQEKKKEKKSTYALLQVNSNATHG